MASSRGAAARAACCTVWSISPIDKSSPNSTCRSSRTRARDSRIRRHKNTTVAARRGPSRRCWPRATAGHAASSAARCACARVTCPQPQRCCISRWRVTCSRRPAASARPASSTPSQPVQASASACASSPRAHAAQRSGWCSSVPVGASFCVRPKPAAPTGLPGRPGAALCATALDVAPSSAPAWASGSPRAAFASAVSPDASSWAAPSSDLAPRSSAPPLLHGSMLPGGRELFVGFWLSRSRACLRSSRARARSPRTVSSGWRSCQPGSICFRS